MEDKSYKNLRGKLLQIEERAKAGPSGEKFYKYHIESEGKTVFVSRFKDQGTPSEEERTWEKEQEIIELKAVVNGNFLNFESIQKADNVSDLQRTLEAEIVPDVPKTEVALKNQVLMPVGFSNKEKDFDMFLNSGAVIARKIGAFIEANKMISIIGGNKHVNIEGWEALGSMIGFHPEVNKVVQGNENGVDYFEAYAQLIDDVSGKVISSASMRTYMDEVKKKRDGTTYLTWTNKFQAYSMSETRAIAKACRNKYAWIMKMQGYEGTPSEEMTED
jgi:hypothetical protein